MTGGAVLDGGSVHDFGAVHDRPVQPSHAGPGLCPSAEWTGPRPSARLPVSVRRCVSRSPSGGAGLGFRPPDPAPGLRRSVGPSGSIRRPRSSTASTDPGFSTAWLRPWTALVVGPARPPCASVLPLLSRPPVQVLGLQPQVQVLDRVRRAGGFSAVWLGSSAAARTVGPVLSTVPLSPSRRPCSTVRARDRAGRSSSPTVRLSPGRRTRPRSPCRGGAGVRGT